MAGLAFSATLFLLPFLNPYHPLPLPSFYSEWLALTGGCLAIALIPFAASDSLRIPAVTAAPLLLAVVIVIQQAEGLSPYIELSMASAGYLLWCAALMIAGANLGERFTLRQLCIAFTFAALAGSLANALFSAIQLYGIAIGNSIAPDFLVSRLAPGAERIYGNLAQANHFSSYMLIGVNAALYLHHAAKLTRFQTWASIIAIALLSLPSGSRSLVLYWAITLFIWKDFFLGNMRKNLRMAIPIALLALLLGSLLLAFLHTSGPQWFSHMLSRLLIWGDLSGHRLYLARHAARMFLEAPFLGAGFHQFAYHMFEQSVSIPETATRWLDVHSHNIFLQLLAVTGVLGFLAVTLPLARWAADFYRSPPSGEKKWALATLGILGLHSLVEYPLWYAYFLGIAALLLGLHASRFHTVAANALTKTLLALACCFGLLILTLSAIDYRTIETKIYRHAQEPAMAAGKDALLEVYRNKIFSRYIELTQPGWVVNDTSPLAEKLALSSRAIRFAPREEIAYRHAILLAANGDAQASLAALRLALAAYPNGKEAARIRLEILSDQDPVLFKPLLDSIKSGNPP